MKHEFPSKRLARMIENLELDISTALYWNWLNPDEKPLDVEDFRVALSMAKKCQASKNPQEAEQWSAAIVAYVNRAMAEKE